jgi:uncharacterized protein (TIGR02118 family)
MFKLTVLYEGPADPAAFDAHYFGTHVPLAEAMPGIRRFEVSKTTGTLDGSAPPYYLQAELYFDSSDALMTALGSAEGQAAAGDMANLTAASVKTVIAEVSHG